VSDDERFARAFAAYQEAPLDTERQKELWAAFDALWASAEQVAESIGRRLTEEQRQRLVLMRRPGCPKGLN
jgi:hypothetical protein